ncbi:MAG: TIR domain-containing protein [Anaerolineaceae bacterium]|nr:TIR domain-containing protein [Anaerolineaceae bacterium]
MNVDTAKLRQFINDKFGPQDLNDLLFDYFRSVYEDVTPGMTKRQQISLLLEFCHQHNQMENLLVAVAQMRPFFQPDDYVQGQKAPTVALPTPAPITRNRRQIFISHAHQDAEVAQRLAQDLAAHGYAIWIAPDSIRPGEKWVEAINRGLEESGIFVLLLSPDAVASRWVQLETNVAITYTHEDEMKLYPLMLKTCRIPALWRAFQHISLRGDYASGYEQLLTTLDQNYSEIFNDPQTLEAIHEHLNPAHGPTQEGTSLPINKIKGTQKILIGTVSVETLGGVATPLIYRSEPLPAEFTQTFSTAEDNQSQVEVHLVYGENRMAVDNSSLGKFVIDGIAPAPKGVPQIRLLVQIDPALKLIVKAEDTATGRIRRLGQVNLGGVLIPETVDPLPPKSSKKAQESDFERMFGGSGGFSDFFEALFGGNPNINRSKKSNQKKDLHVNLTITFDEAINGTEKDIKFYRPESCTKCFGSGMSNRERSETCVACEGTGEVQSLQQVRVKIPPGVDSGTKIRLKGQGASDPNGNQPGNLFIDITVQEHEFLVRKGKDLYLKLPLKPIHAKNGGSISVPTANRFITLTIPPDTKHGKIFRLRGLGVHDSREPDANHGHMFIEILELFLIKEMKNLDTDSHR